MKIEGQVRIPSGCAISAVISKDGNKMSGESITNSMKPMHDRSNGLGGGFAGYGIYPEYRDLFALHLFFRDNSCRKTCEAFLKERFDVVWAEEALQATAFILNIKNFTHCICFLTPAIQERNAKLF